MMNRPIDRRALLGGGMLALAGVRRAARARPGGGARISASTHSPAEWKADARRAALADPARGGDRAGLHQPAARRAPQGDVRLRRLRAAAVQLGDQVRERHRLAELLAAAAACRRRAHRPQPADGAHRSAVRALRRASRPRLRRRAQADRPALLHERAGAEVPRRLTTRRRCAASRACPARRSRRRRARPEAARARAPWLRGSARRSEANTYE